MGNRLNDVVFSPIEAKPKLLGPKDEFSLERQGFAVELGVQVSDYIRMSSMKLGV
jgi:hypothetical protein